MTIIIVIITIRIIIILPVPGGGRGAGQAPGISVWSEGRAEWFWVRLHSPFSREGHGAEQAVGSRWEGEAPLCAGPWAGLAAALGDRRLGSHSEAGSQNPDSPSQFLLFLAHSTPWCVGFASRFGGRLPGLEFPGPSVRQIGEGPTLEKMTPSQQWKEEPISQQCRGWGCRAGREWSPGPLCGADKVRKLRLNGRKPSAGGPFPRMGASGTAQPAQHNCDLCVWGDSDSVHWAVNAGGPRLLRAPCVPGWALGAQTLSW